MTIMYLSTQVFLFFLVIQNAVWSCRCSNSSYVCPEAERTALLNFKHSFDDDPGAVLASWEGINCCLWYGVGCDMNTGHVVHVDLQTEWDASGNRSSFALAANRLDPSLLKLKYLIYLDLSGNDFRESVVPEFLGEMNGLKYLNLSHANFTAASDLEVLGNLTSLEILDLGGIDLSGVHNLLRLLNQLHSLSELSLSFCQLHGAQLSTANSNVTFLSTLQKLHLGNNLLGGSFPIFLKNMTSLRVLDLSYNAYANSSVPMWLTNLKELEYLDLSGNQFDKAEGGLWRILSSLCHLKSLDISSNNFQPESSLYSEKTTLWGCIGYELEVFNARKSGLTGGLPDELHKFEKLSKMDLSENSLQGSIPAWIGNLSVLIELRLGYNQLNGTIPSEIGNLWSLQHLSLANNQLYGTIPTTIGHLSALQLLSLVNNQLHGTIPTTIGNLSALQQFSLAGNQLHGTIPTTIGNLSALQQLSLAGNQLHGTIPTTIGNLSALTFLDLSHNQLVGDVPDSIGKLASLDYIDISSNYLTGNIYESHFSNLTILRVLMLYSNQLTIMVSSDWIPSFQVQSMNMGSCKIGPDFPRWLGTQTKLIYLDLSNASITSPWPKWFQSSVLGLLDLSDNQIGEHIPHNIADLFPALYYLQLSNNLINGTVPSSLCKMGSLLEFDISGNMLSGNIPDCWEDMQPLQIIKLSFNKLTGVIPSSFGNLSMLSRLHLNNNLLKGDLSLSLRNCKQLVVLNLGNNGFEEKLPTLIGSMRKLNILGLRNNSFVGDIPVEYCEMSSLRILDLAYNNLTGNIPSCLCNLTAMTIQGSLDLPGSTIADEVNIVLMVKRNAREYTIGRWKAPVVVAIDLSSNKLVGMIPPEVTLLYGLISLNLSSNHLRGSIPMNIGNLTALESFDLSSNQLSGNIPIGVSFINTLSSLDFSHNNLSGRIPTGNQLQTLVDPSIYAGNPYLCGAPLAQKCVGDDKPIHVPDSHEKEDDKSDKIWLYLAITVGYAAGLWAFFSILIFKKKWRYAYFRYVDDAQDWIYVFMVVNARRLKRKMTGMEE